MLVQNISYVLLHRLIFALPCRTDCPFPRVSYCSRNRNTPRFSTIVLQTGQPMEQLSLVPNLNLRRLIKDLLNEGGEGLYVHHADVDDGDGEMQSEGEEGGEEQQSDGDQNRKYRFALVTEHILVLKVSCGICVTTS